MTWLITSKKQRPPRPAEPSVRDELGLDDAAWGVIQQAWAQSPSQRPTAASAAQQFGALSRVHERRRQRERVVPIVPAKSTSRPSTSGSQSQRVLSHYPTSPTTATGRSTRSQFPSPTVRTEVLVSGSSV